MVRRRSLNGDRNKSASTHEIKNFFFTRLATGMIVTSRMAFLSRASNCTVQYGNRLSEHSRRLVPCERHNYKKKHFSLISTGVCSATVDLRWHNHNPSPHSCMLLIPTAILSLYMYC